MIQVKDWFEGLMNEENSSGGFQKGDDAYKAGDYATALAVFTPLAKAGNDLAQYSLSAMYFYGRGVPQDYAEAVKWARLAAETGNADAQNALGVMYSNGNAEAVKWARLAAETGNADAQNAFGVVMYSNGMGIPQDYAEAVKWFRLAAEAGNACAQHNLGGMYRYGNGVPQDEAEAIKWIRLAAEAGAYAQFKLEEIINDAVNERFFDMEARHKGSVAYNAGDYATALAEWTPLAEAGDVRAQYGLGRMYADGDGVEQDDKKAEKWRSLAARSGVGTQANAFSAAMLAGSINALEDYTKTEKSFRRAAEAGDNAAQFNLGYMYNLGMGVTRDDVEAVKWYRLAAEAGNALAQFRLGIMYRYGNGVPQDEAEAIKWIHLAAEAGDADAQFNLGLMYRKGEGVPQDEAEAIKWIRLAAEAGNASAQFHLERMDDLD